MSERKQQEEDDEVEEVTRLFDKLSTRRVESVPIGGGIPYPTDSELMLWRDAKDVVAGNLLQELFDQKYSVVTPFATQVHIDLFVEFFAANFAQTLKEDKAEKAAELVGDMATHIFGISAYSLRELYLLFARRHCFKQYAINAFTYDKKHRGIYDLATPSWEHRWTSLTECGGGCGKSNVKLLPCPRCRCVVYCGSECQKKDWSVHKPRCAYFKEHKSV